MEVEFWRIVEQGGPAVEATCAVGLDTTTCGSGFPQVPSWVARSDSHWHLGPSSEVLEEIFRTSPYRTL